MASDDKSLGEIKSIGSEWVLLMSSKRSNKPSLTFEKRTRGMNETLRKQFGEQEQHAQRSCGRTVSDMMEEQQ